MVSEGVVWTLEKDLCRCCHAEGKFENLATPQSFMDQQEIYLHMLRECFDIDISPVPGPLCNVTYTICSICVVKLRYANTFKQQVLKCEEKFSELLFKNSILVPGYVKSEPEGDLDDFKDSSPDDSDDDNNKPLYEYKLEVEVDSDEDKDEDKSEDEDEGESMHQINLRKRPAKDVKKHTSDDAGSVKLKKTTKPKAKPKAPAKTTAKETQETAPSEKKKEDWREVKFLKKEDNGAMVWQCVDCGRNFKKRDHFCQHYKFVHLKLRPKVRSCHLCNVKVPTQYRPFHMEQAHGLPAPTCGACGKKFAFPNQVLRHQKAYHMGEKQFDCPLCEMKFVSKNLLLKHSIKHTPLRPYQCNYCDKSFRWKKNLKTHIHMHLDVRKHVCRICHESFVQQSSLKYHMTRRHMEAL